MFLNIISKTKYRLIAMVLKTLWETKEQRLYFFLIMPANVSHNRCATMRNYASLGDNELVQGESNTNNKSSELFENGLGNWAVAEWFEKNM